MTGKVRIGGRHRHHRHSRCRWRGFDLPLRSEGAARPDPGCPAFRHPSTGCVGHIQEGRHPAPGAPGGRVPGAACRRIGRRGLPWGPGMEETPSRPPRPGEHTRGHGRYRPWPRAVQRAESPGSISLACSGSNRLTIVSGAASIPKAFRAAAELRRSFASESSTRSMKVVAISSL